MVMDGVDVLLGAVLLDLLFGELPARAHPVVWMGHLIRAMDRRLPRDGWPALLGGVVLVGVTSSISVAVACALLWGTSEYVWVHGVVATTLMTTTFSVSLLLREVGGLGALLRAGKIDEAREFLPRLCSRDASQLGQESLGAAGVASGVENTVDSIVAPWLWWLVLGIPGAVLYRSINTMDAMVGYRGEYERLGKAAARLDDIANWVPARVTAVLMWVVGVGRGADAPATRSRAWAVACSDARETPSPNGGWPMAMAAGLLGRRLEKSGVYVLNRMGRPVTATDLDLALRLIRRTAALALVLVVSLHLVVHP